MRVGTTRILLRLPNSFSLKDKRRIVKGLITKLRNDFNVSVAEVGATDDERRAELGVAFVSNDGRFNHRVIDRLIGQVERYPGVFLEDHQSEFL